MPIPFQDQEIHSYGTAGYLTFLPPTPKGVWLGALFVMNAYGEPVEFTHARVSSPNPVLWQPDHLRARCVESLCASMFDVCPVVPDLVLCLAEEVGPRMLGDDLRPDIPIGRITRDGSGGNISTEWSTDFIADSAHDRLYKRLCERGLLLEPFERAITGLRQVYGELLR